MSDSIEPICQNLYYLRMTDVAKKTIQPIRSQIFFRNEISLSV
jgi:hypothetical protein